jgi:glycosyltransferase involved in cell wall biosynthesis
MPLLVSLLPTDLAFSHGGGERYAFEVHRSLCDLLPDWDHLALGATTDPEREPLPDGWTDITRFRGRRKPHSQDALDVRRMLRLVPRDARLVVASQWHTLSTLALRLRPRSGTLAAIDLGGGSLAAGAIGRLPLPKVDVATYKTSFEEQWSPIRARHGFVMRCGLDDSFFTPPQREERDVDFLLVARFLPHKGQREFVQALPEGARGRLVGPRGTDRPEYQQEVFHLAEERGVAVDLDLTDGELVEAYRRARYTVQVPIARPGEAPELLGLTMLEAMACGSVPISPTGGPSAEFARDGDTGIEYRAGDVADLTRVMTAALGDEERRRLLAAGALEETRSWTWRSGAQQLIDESGIG